MTQQELADAIDVTRQTVVAIEGDEFSPSLEVAFRIAVRFAGPLEAVFQYSPPATTGRKREGRSPFRLPALRDKCS